MTRDEIINAFNAVLKKHGLALTLTLGDLSITKNVITDPPTEDLKLSNTLANYIWPSIAEKEVFHFTSRVAAESIVSTNRFRMYWLIKRFTEEEIVSFCRDHGVNGYLAKDSNEEPKYKSLIMEQMFYASFAGTNITRDQENQLWNSFSRGDGARLRIRIRAINPDFRQIVYSSIPPRPIQVLAELSYLAARTKRLFLLQGISRLCAFYLPTQYFTENEYRILVKNFGNINGNVKKDVQHSYVELPLGRPNFTGFELSVIDIQTADGSLGGCTHIPIAKRE